MKAEQTALQAKKKADEAEKMRQELLTAQAAAEREAARVSRAVERPGSGPCAQGGERGLAALAATHSGLQLAVALSQPSRLRCSRSISSPHTAAAEAAWHTHWTGACRRCGRSLRRCRRAPCLVHGSKLACALTVPRLLILEAASVPLGLLTPQPQP